MPTFHAARNHTEGTAYGKEARQRWVVNFSPAACPGSHDEASAPSTSEHLPLSNAALTTVRRWGLEVRLNRVDPRSFLGLLGDRFNYWDDDVDHEPIFKT